MVPDNPPINPPVTLGTGHVNKVPAGITPFITSVGVMANEDPLLLTKVI